LRAGHKPIEKKRGTLTTYKVWMAAKGVSPRNWRGLNTKDMSYIS